MTKHEYPEWATKYRTKGTTLRKKGSGYALLKVTSTYVKGSYPRISQTYLGMVTEDGFHPAKVDIRDASLVEWGLSSFLFERYHRELQRACYGASGDFKEAIIRMGIVYFAHGSYSEDVLRSSYLTCGGLDGILAVRKTTSKSRIEAMRTKVDSLLRKDFPDDEVRNELIALLRMEMADSRDIAKKKEHSARARELLGGKEE